MKVPAAGGAQRRQKWGAPEAEGRGGGRLGRGPARRRLQAGTGSEGRHGRLRVEGRVVKQRRIRQGLAWIPPHLHPSPR